MTSMLLTGLCVAGAVIIVALIMRRPRLPAGAVAERTGWRDSAFANMLLSVAASVGIARAQANSGESHSDTGYSWHGGHLGHGAGHGSGFTDGSGFGGDAGGGAP